MPSPCRKGFVALTDSLLQSLFTTITEPTFAIADSNQRELPDYVRHHFQSLTPAATCHPHQDRLEQNPQLQDWQRNAECLMWK